MGTRGLARAERGLTLTLTLALTLALTPALTLTRYAPSEAVDQLVRRTVGLWRRQLAQGAQRKVHSPNPNPNPNPNSNPNPHKVWSGYFTSRPALKGYIRSSSATFSAARILHALASAAKFATDDAAPRARAASPARGGPRGGLAPRRYHRNLAAGRGLRLCGQAGRRRRAG